MPFKFKNDVTPSIRLIDANDQNNEKKASVEAQEIPSRHAAELSTSRSRVTSEVQRLVRRPGSRSNYLGEDGFGIASHFIRFISIVGPSVFSHALISSPTVFP